ncbi:transglycosylase domain-containing protein [Streptomyces catenulae]|uniref:Transglycosylase domain-containing protein n=1 Tax=Streptomyces catenulae TaxID=66875 RepID=A0ABV2YTK1_9ACTN|nr:transglycosylase domain-containing protein [Streptomyces catenulae]
MGRADATRARQGSRGAGPRPKGRIRRLFTWKKMLGTFFGICLLGIAAAFGLYFYVDVPAAGTEIATAQSNVYKYADGKVLARTGKLNRESVPLSRVPLEVQHTFVAAENKTFYDDHGIDLKGTFRGIFKTLQGEGKQGGSTITQQYVKNYYLSQEQTVSRKLQEIVISLKVDNEKSKSEILDGYLNTSYYGRGAYGIQAAAQAYYRKDAEQLTVSQGAYLASLLQAPNQYDWALATPTGKKLVQQRWAYTLDNMVEMKWLSKADRDKQKFDVPKDPKPQEGLTGSTGYLVQAAKDELFAHGVDEKKFALGGWTVTLGVEKDKQLALERAVKRKLTADLDPKLREADRNAQLGAASVDPSTGHIVAMYGGAGYTQHYINNATRQDYQPASTFKPLILATALENHATTQDGRPITPDTVYDGTNRRPVTGGTAPFAPPNEDQRSYGNITVQKAMNNSVNSVFAQMGADVGLDSLKKTATSLGMNGARMDVQPAMTLGSMGASPVQMAGVYATFDNHGRKVTPTLVTKAEHATDPEPDLPDPIGDQVLSRKTADTVTSVLRGVVDDGTATAVQDTSYQAAGKTGTSDDNKSAWFVGYTPKLVTAVGMFGEAQGGKQVTLRGAGGGGRVNGGGYPAQVWAAYNAAALGSGAGATFDLDADSGMGVAPPPPTDTSPPASETPSGTPTESESPSGTPTHDPTPTDTGDPTPTDTGSAPTDPGTGGTTSGTTGGPGGANGGQGAGGNNGTGGAGGAGNGPGGGADGLNALN